MGTTNSIRLSKISIRQVNDSTDYATTEALAESLNTLRATYNLPINQYMRDLFDGRVDSISLTKDDPYYYFYARKLKEAIAVTFKQTGRVVEFSLSLQEAEKTLIA